MYKRILIKYNQVTRLAEENQSVEMSSQPAISDLENKSKDQQALLNKVNADIAKTNDTARVTSDMSADLYQRDSRYNIYA